MEHDQAQRADAWHGLSRGKRVLAGAALLATVVGAGLLLLQTSAPEPLRSTLAAPPPDPLKAKRGDMEVSVAAVFVCPASEPLAGAPGLFLNTAETYLTVEILLKNAKAVGVMHFPDLRNPDRTTLIDDRGNACPKWLGSQRTQYAGRDGGPGDGLIIPVAFEKPRAGWKHLDLLLDVPGLVARESDRIPFRITPSMVKEEAKADASAEGTAAK